MNNEEIRKCYKCLHLADYSPKNQMCRAIERIIELEEIIKELEKQVEGYSGLSKEIQEEYESRLEEYYEEG